jgi:glycosyltransferase involved in cell wall biosynthesis
VRVVLGRRRTSSVGIVSNEFFDAGLGRMGGFGWAARRSAECFAQHPELGLEPLFLAGAGELEESRERSSNGTPLLRFEGTRAYRRSVRSARARVLLTIDYRPGFLPVLDSLPAVPLVVWIRDPRTSEDIERIATLRLPSSDAAPAGLARFDLTSLADVVESRRSSGMGVVVAATAPGLARPRLEATYGLDAEDLELLPNPLDVAPDGLPRAEHPRVVFLGRIDPIKRPWIFVELARRMLHVEFVVAGGSYQSGPGAWEPTSPPENLRVLGHVDGEEKTRLLASAWALVNCSIHESLPISFLEALHCATPVVSCQDPEGVTSRFGAFVGRWDGSGEDAVDAFVDALGSLLDDRDRRESLGEAGRAWARATHTRARFVETFAELVGRT